MNRKICNSCSGSGDLDEFDHQEKVSQTRRAPRFWCKPCVRTQLNHYYAGNPEAYDAHLLRIEVANQEAENNEAAVHPATLFAPPDLEAAFMEFSTSVALAKGETKKPTVEQPEQLYLPLGQPNKRILIG